MSKRLLITMAAALLAFSGRGHWREHRPPGPHTVTLPDMQIEVPTDAISIGTTGGTKQLRFTHITWDAGTGPFEIDPTFNSSDRNRQLQPGDLQQPQRGRVGKGPQRAAAGNRRVRPAGQLPVPADAFTLNQVNTDGSLGAVVATSPKNGLLHHRRHLCRYRAERAERQLHPAEQLHRPDQPLGWSVGWGDEYDQTDPGQPIDITNVPNGTYILHGVVDPQHLLTESNPMNNVTDTLLQISGTTVTVLSQTQPGSTPPAVTMTSPADGSTASGTVTVSATATPVAPATISSVQFLLDGQPLGAPVTSAPYTFNWTVGSTTPGSHTLSARATDSNGNMATAVPVTVTVPTSGGGGGGGGPAPTVDKSVTVTGHGATMPGVVHHGRQRDAGGVRGQRRAVRRGPPDRDGERRRADLDAGEAL